VDRKLLAWGLRRRPGGLPRLWLYTDDKRLPDPRRAVARLPHGRAGVVLRHDGAAARVALGRDVARICRARRLTLVVAGDVRLAHALGAGVHLRRGWRPGVVRLRRPVTSSAHSVPELRRAARAGAALAFLSPAFPTASHQNAPALGPARWAALAGRLRATPGAIRLAALGGVDGDTIRRLPSWTCQAAGAVGALSG